MLSLISSRVLSQRISLAGKYFRIALFCALCLLVIAPSLPAQAQSFNQNGFTGRVVYVAKHRFQIEITAVPANTIMVSATATGGGVTSNWGKSFGNKTVPITINVGATIGGGGLADIANDYIKPGTSYTVKLQARDFLDSTLASASLTVRTHGQGPGLPGVEITNLSRTDYSISFEIVPFAGADFHRVSKHSGDVDRGSYTCRTTRSVTQRVYDPKRGESRTVTSVYYNPPPANRNGRVHTNNLKIISGDPMRHNTPFGIYYCNLAADTTFYVLVEAWRQNEDNYAWRIAAKTHAISTLPMPSPQLLGSDSQDNELVPTALPPIYIEVDYPGNPLTDVSLAWSAVSGATGYLLQVSGGNSESYTFNLGAGATSQRVNGLTPGADYTAYLTAYLQDGGKRTGEAHFGMADPPPPPTNTPIPPTATPIPQQSSQDSVQQQDPPQLQYSQMQAEDDDPQPSGPYASLIRTLIGYQGETQHGDAHVLRWTRALAALGWGSHSNPMTLSEAKTMRDKYSTSRWQPVVDALTVLQPPPTNTPVPPPPPTNTPIPPPPPTNTPIPPPPPTNTPVPPPPDPEPEKEAYTVPQSLINTLIGYQGETQHGDAHVKRWTRALAALGHGSHNNPMTLSEAEDMADKYTAKRWQPVIDALEKLAEN